MKYNKLNYKVSVIGKGISTVYEMDGKYFIRIGTFTYSGTYTNKNMKMEYVEITKPKEVEGYFISEFKK